MSYSVPSGTYNANQTVTVTPSDAVSGVGVWAVHTYNAGALNYSNQDWTKSNSNLTGYPSYDVTLTEGIWTIYSSVYDNASNIIVQEPNNGDGWHYETYTIDTTPPTVWYSLSEGTYTGTQTLTIIPNDNLTGVGVWAVHVYKDGVKIEEQSNNYLTGQPNFTVTLTEGSTWTIYATVYDNAGNLINQQPNNGTWFYQNYIIQSNGGENLKTLQSTTSTQYLREAYSGDELLRYIGEYSEITNNYICFGTSDVNACTSNPDTYMYRIIGIQKSDNDTLGLKMNQLKIIKATPIKNDDGKVSEGAWSADGNINWDHDRNSVRTYLNTTFLSTIDGTWQTIISNPKWYMGDNGELAATATGMMSNEKTATTNASYKIGLMYASDYYYSWEYPSSWSSEDVNTNSWLHIAHGTSSSPTYPSRAEWTMARFGKYSIHGYYAWAVFNRGFESREPVDNAGALRPVFYLSSNIKISGNGIETSPFIITFT